jgi:hypothetical protein
VRNRPPTSRAKVSISKSRPVISRSSESIRDRDSTASSAETVGLVSSFCPLGPNRSLIGT